MRSFHLSPSDYRLDGRSAFSIAFVLILLAMLFVLPAVTEATPTAKILNGPPHELSATRLPVPLSVADASTGIERSIELDPTKPLVIPSDPGRAFRLTVMGAPAELDALLVHSPNGSVSRLDALPEGDGSRKSDLPIVLQTRREGVARIDVRAAAADRPYRLGTVRSAAKSGNETEPRSVFVRVENLDSYTARLATASWQRRAGEPLTLQAVIENAHGVEAEVTVESVDLRMHGEDGWSRRWSSRDRLEWAVMPEKAGIHTVEADLVARGPNGERIERSLRSWFRVAPGGLDIAEPVARLVPDDRFHGDAYKAASYRSHGKPVDLESTRLRFDVPLQTNSTLPGRAIVRAELWGQDALGRSEAVAWLGGIKTLNVDAGGQVTLPLGVDARWFHRSTARPPFELRALRLQDVDTFAILASADRLPVDSSIDLDVLLAGDDVESKAGAEAPAIDDTMRFGPTPADFDTRQLKNGLPIERLVLGHDSCDSKDSWSPYANHFWANPDAYGKGKVHLFNDPYEPRSHDAFAQELLSFILARPNGLYSVIGHGQSGLAAVHLMAFYNVPRIENSTVTHKVQTLVSPWGGIPLMDELAQYKANGGGLLGPLPALRMTVGNLFPCGVVENLTSSSAQLWRASLPPSVLASVRSYRARGGFFPCNATLSFYTPGHDDGIVPIDAQTMPGVSDGGLKVHQCHRASDPLITFDHMPVHQDVGRNRVMAEVGRNWYVKTCFNFTQSSGFAPATIDLDSSCTILEPGVSIQPLQWHIRPEHPEQEGNPAGEYFAQGTTAQVVVDQPGEYVIELTADAYVDGQWRLDRFTLPLRVAGGDIPLCSPFEVCPWLCENPADCPEDDGSGL